MAGSKTDPPYGLFCRSKPLPAVRRVAQRGFDRKMARLKTVTPYKELPFSVIPAPFRYPCALCHPSPIPSFLPLSPSFLRRQEPRQAAVGCRSHLD